MCPRPTIHAKILLEDGSLSSYTADIWSKSMSNPASAYTRLDAPPTGSVAASSSSETLGDGLPSVGEALAVTEHSQARLGRLQRNDPAQAPGGAPTRPAQRAPGVGA